MDCTLRQIAEKLKQANNVAIVTHMRPDGDTFGCAFALSAALHFLGLNSQVYNESEPPSNLLFLEELKGVKQTIDQPYDLLIALDCSEMHRIGNLMDEFSTAKRKKIPTINIDHHISNTHFADYNYVRECSANCMNVATLLDELGAPIDKQIANYLLLGLLTDSGNFSHDDVTEETLLLGARLVKAGADISGYQYNLFKKQSKARAKLFAQTMSKIRYYYEDRLAVIVVTQQAMAECAADAGMTEGFVDFPLNVDTVEVAVSIMEVKKNKYKISLRSKKYADVNKIAGVYGGGGHIRAAGCMLFGDIEEVIDRLAYTVSQYLE